MLNLISDKSYIDVGRGVSLDIIVRFFSFLLSQNLYSRLND